MQHISFYFKKTIIFALFSIILCGCSPTKTVLVCPYTDVAWETTPEQLSSAKGDCLSSYASTYGGMTYTYDGIYLNRAGTLKYMYDNQNTLKSIAWAYSSDSGEELLALYEEMHADIVAQYGESGYNTNSIGNYGDVWKMDSGNIILSVMITETNKALQIAYVYPSADS